MAYGSRFENPFGGFRVTPWVRRLLIANTAVFTVMLVLDLMNLEDAAVGYLAFRPSTVLWTPWTPLTYGFTHADLFHWLFNMIGLFFFGPRLEERWGSRGFLKYYGVALLGGALLSLFQPTAAIIGASAAVYGLLAAYAYYWPDAEVYFWGIFPIKMKWMVIGLIAISVLGSLGAGAVGGGGVAHLAHLGGIVTGLLYLRSRWAPSGWGDVPTYAAKRKKPTRTPALSWKLGRGKPEEPPAPRPIRPAREDRAERELLDEVDRILDKISVSGIQSLSEEERKKLHELSRQKRTN